METERSPMLANLNAQQQAYVHIQDQIISGALMGGTRLKPELIAQMLGLSRMPVREAIRQLDAEGYVTIRPNRGAVVKARSPAEVIELFEMRAVLEGLAVRLGAERLTPEMLDELEMQNERLNRSRANTLVWIDRHERFHDEVCATSGRKHLESECKRLRLAVSPYLRLYLRNHGNPERPGTGHEALLEALRSRDPKYAEAAMRAHVMANAQNIADCLRVAPDDVGADEEA